MQVKVIGYDKPKKSRFAPIKNADETNVSGVGNVTAVREHLGLPNSTNNEMAATLRSDLPLRNIEGGQLRAQSKQSGRPMSPTWSASSSRSKVNPATGGTLSPNVVNKQLARNTARENGFGKKAEQLVVPNGMG